MPYTAKPLILDPGEEPWQRQLDGAERWLGDVLLAQAAFRRLAEDTAGRLDEPQVRDYVAELAALAARQERRARQMFGVIGRTPPSGRHVGGSKAARIRQALADVQGVASGAPSGWRDLYTLLLADVNAMAAFAVAEQLGLALGLHELVDLAFPVIQELSSAQMLLQEFMLDMAPPAMLFGRRP